MSPQAAFDIFFAPLLFAAAGLCGAAAVLVMIAIILQVRA